ncbi:MAG: hypothetical protein L0Z62_30855 [Gemmataceae bacterium]|nr:hypothetical protein [Gemmataceae bacterium]
MSVLSTANPQLQAAVRNCVRVLRRLAEYTLPPALDQHMRQLGERKESLSPDEQEQLLALVTFTEQRTLEKLQAELALKQLQTLFPDEAGA